MAFDLKKKLATSPNSTGFLLQRMVVVELLLAKNIFGARDVKVIAPVGIEKKDTKEWKILGALLSFLNNPQNTY
jgi:hypothetical protein